MLTVIPLSVVNLSGKKWRKIIKKRKRNVNGVIPDVEHALHLFSLLFFISSKFFLKGGKM
jgi:hypothetical protein